LGAAGEEVLFNSALVCLLLNGWPTNPRTVLHKNAAAITPSDITVNIREQGIPAKCAAGKKTDCSMVSA
jgi:hypothetical protein